MERTEYEPIHKHLGGFLPLCLTVWCILYAFCSCFNQQQLLHNTNCWTRWAITLWTMPWNCLHSLCQPLYCFYLMIFIIIFSLLNRRKYEFKQLFDASNRINTIGNRVLFVIVYFLWFMCWICICWECAAIERLKCMQMEDGALVFLVHRKIDTRSAQA